MTKCKNFKLYGSDLNQQPPPKEKAQSRLAVPPQSLQSLQERVPKGIPVGGAERVQQGVDCFVVGGL